MTLPALLPWLLATLEVLTLTSYLLILLQRIGISLLQESDDE